MAVRSARGGGAPPMSVVAMSSGVGVVGVRFELGEREEKEGARIGA
jgi:hypothetical protein